MSFVYNYTLVNMIYVYIRTHTYIYIIHTQSYKCVCVCVGIYTIYNTYAFHVYIISSDLSPWVVPTWIHIRKLLIQCVLRAADGTNICICICYSWIAMIFGKSFLLRIPFRRRYSYTRQFVLNVTRFVYGDDKYKQSRISREAKMSWRIS